MSTFNLITASLTISNLIVINSLTMVNLKIVGLIWVSLAMIKFSQYPIEPMKGTQETPKIKVLSQGGGMWVFLLYFVFWMSVYMAHTWSTII